MYELERKYPIDIGPIFNALGFYVGNGYTSTKQANTVLIKTPFTENHLISEIAPLISRGYQFLNFPYNPPGAPGLGAASEEQYKGVSPWNSH